MPGDDWIFGPGDPTKYLEGVQSDAGTSAEGPLTGWLARNYAGFSGDPGYAIVAARNQARGQELPMQQLAEQSNPLLAQLRLQGGRSIARNPYSAATADQTRAAQIALVNQMRGQMQGPSLAAMQGQRAMAQSGQQALGAAAMGAPNRAAMLNAQQVGGGLAGDVGQARLAEVMRAQAGMGGAAGNLRGADVTSAGNQMQSGLRAQGLADENARWAASQGAALSDANRNAQLEYYKLIRRLQLKNQERAAQTAKDTGQAVGTAIKMGAGGI